MYAISSYIFLLFSLVFALFFPLYIMISPSYKPNKSKINIFIRQKKKCSEWAFNRNVQMILKQNQNYYFFR